MLKISFFIRAALCFFCSVFVYAATIDSIVVEGAQFTQVDIVKQALPLQVGDSADKVAISNAIKAIYATGFYQDVAIKQVEGILTVSVVENPMIRSVETTGDKYVIKKEQLDVDALFDDSSNAKYHYNGGFNRKAILAWILSGYIAVGTVWPNILVLGLGDFFANLGGGGGYAWIIGASLGAVVHLAISKR